MQNDVTLNYDFAQVNAEQKAKEINTLSAMMENGVVMLLATILPHNKAFKAQSKDTTVDWNAIAVKVAQPVFAPPMPGMPYQGQDDEEEAKMQVGSRLLLISSLLLLS